MNNDKTYYVSGWVICLDIDGTWHLDEFKNVRIQSYSGEKSVLQDLISFENDWDGFEIKEILNKEEINGTEN